MMKKDTRVKCCQTLWKSPRGPETCETTSDTSAEGIMQQLQTEVSHNTCQYLHGVKTVLVINSKAG